MGSLPLAVLFAPYPGALVALLSCDSNSWWPLGFPRHLLLLPQGLLPFVLSRSTGLFGWRISPAQIPRRNCIPAHITKPPSLFPLRGSHLPDYSLVRRDSRFLV